MSIQIHNHSILTIAGQPTMVPTLLVEALADDWAEVASACDIALTGRDAILLSKYGTHRLWATDDDEGEPEGWWARFVVISGPDSTEIRDRLHGEAYDITLLSMFLRGMIAPDAFDSPEVLRITQDVHQSFYGCAWASMPGQVA